MKPVELLLTPRRNTEKKENRREKSNKKPAKETARRRGFHFFAEPTPPNRSIFSHCQRFLLLPDPPGPPFFSVLRGPLYFVLASSTGPLTSFGRCAPLHLASYSSVILEFFGFSNSRLVSQRLSLHFRISSIPDCCRPLAFLRRRFSPHDVRELQLSAISFTTP